MFKAGDSGIDEKLNLNDRCINFVAEQFRTPPDHYRTGLRCSLM